MTFLTLLAIRLTLGEHSTPKCLADCADSRTACKACCLEQPAIRYWWDCDGDSSSPCCGASSSWSFGPQQFSTCYDSPSTRNAQKPCNLVVADMCAECDDDDTAYMQVRADMCAVPEDAIDEVALFVWKMCVKTLAYDFIFSLNEGLAPFCSKLNYTDAVAFETYVDGLEAKPARLGDGITNQTNGISMCWDNWGGSTTTIANRLMNPLGHVCACTPAVRYSPTCAASVLEWDGNPTALTDQVTARSDHLALAAASVLNSQLKAPFITEVSYCGDNDCIQKATAVFKAETDAQYSNFTATHWWILAENAYTMEEVKKLAVVGRDIQDCAVTPCTNAACRDVNTPPPSPPAPAAPPAPTTSTGTSAVMWVGIAVAIIIALVIMIMLLCRLCRTPSDLQIRIMF